MGAIIPKPVREGFDPLRPNPNPLGGRDADMCLYAAEKIDGYRASILKSPLNSKARANQSYNGATTIVKIPIKDAVAPWWSGQVLWLEATADGGLPHTRPPGYICLPKNIDVARVDSVLLHERVHLHQRRYPDIWIKFVKDKWNMEPWTGSLPAEIEKARRINPDLIANPFFIWKKKWVSFAIYDDTGSPSLSATSTNWYNVALKTTTRIPPDGWLDFFGSVLGDEHPWELAAYYVQDASIKSPAKDLLMKAVPKLPKTFL